MGILTRDADKKVKQALKNAGKPLGHDEIARRSQLDKETTKKVVSDLVDRGELKPTLDWKYEISK